MAIPLTIAGFTYNFPQSGDVGYAGDVDNWATAVSNNIEILRAYNTLQYAEYNTTAQQSIPNATPTIVNFATKVADANNLVTTGAAWKFTAATPGMYQVEQTATIAFGNATTFLYYAALYLNGVELDRGLMLDGTTTSLGGGLVGISEVYSVYMNANDYIQPYVYQTNGGSAAKQLSAPAVSNRIVIYRVPTL